VNSESEAIVAVSLLPQLSRSHIRHRFERRFTARRMANEYVEVYEAMMRSAARRDSLKVLASKRPHDYNGRIVTAP
jgi:hypothetical protein